MDTIKKLDKSSLLLIITILFLLLALPLTLLLSRQRQEIRKRASVPTGGIATMRFDPKIKSDIPANQNFPVAIKVVSQQVVSPTPGYRGIARIVVALSYTKNDAQPFTITANDITKGFPDTWAFTKSVTENGNIVSINIDAVYNSTGDGYSIISEQTFATLTFHVPNSGGMNLVFDPTQTVIQAKGGLVDILATPEDGQYQVQVGGGATGTPTPTEGVTGTPTPTTTPGATVTPTSTPTVTPTPTGGITPTPTGAPVISRVSNYCGKPSETILTIYGTNFGASQGTSKVYFRYKASSIAENSTYKEALADIVSWTNTTVFAIVPTVDFGGNNDVVSKVKLVKQGYTNYPANFPPGEVAFFSISRDSARNIGDLDCNNAVDYKDFAILFNNWPRQ